MGMPVRTLVGIVAALSFSAPLLACSFCADGLTRRVPLSQHYAEAQLVVFGVLKNPRPAADGLGGTTELHITSILKAPEGHKATTLIRIPRYLPVIADTPPEYVLFCSLKDNAIEPSYGVSAGPTITKYLSGASALDRQQPTLMLGYYLGFLQDSDETVANDAFLEFARASDKEIQAIAPHLSREHLRNWIADPKTPAERLGVYAMMLGLCGTPEDARWLASLISQQPLPDRYAGALGGLLAGLTSLDSPTGWKLITDILEDQERNFTDKLSAISMLRYFQSTRWKEEGSSILAAYRLLIASGDLADMAIEDLRRWQVWDLTAEILASFDKPSHKAPVVRRSIVRYALAGPQETCGAFLNQVRQTEPELVRKVEATARLYDLPKGEKR